MIQLAVHALNLPVNPQATSTVDLTLLDLENKFKKTWSLSLPQDNSSAHAGGSLNFSTMCLRNKFGKYQESFTNL